MINYNTYYYKDKIEIQGDIYFLTRNGFVLHYSELLGSINWIWTNKEYEVKAIANDNGFLYSIDSGYVQRKWLAPDWVLV